jgi:hypothetical protein
VNLHVRLEIGALIEAAMADGTFVWRLLQVRDFMHGQCARLTEAFAAIVTLEGLLFGVNVAMIAKMILPPERFAADVTRVRTLVGVRSLVYQQIVRLGELSIAIFADELLLWTCASGAGDFQWAQPITMIANDG